MKNFVTPNSHPSSFFTGSTVENMVKKAKTLETGYYTCTDNGYLTNVLKAYSYTKKNDLKLIAGCELYFYDSKLFAGSASEKIKYFTITLHAKTQEAYQFLVKKASDQTKTTINILDQEFPLFDWKDLEEFSKYDFTAVCGGPQCMVNKHHTVGNTKAAFDTFVKLKELFSDDFYASIMPYKFDRKWYSSSVFTFTDGIEAELDSNYMAETDYTKNFRVPIKEVAENHAKHGQIKKIYVNGIGYNVNKTILSSLNLNKFTPIGTDIYKTYNEFTKKMCARYGVKMLLNDYSYLANKGDKLVQDMKLGDDTRFYVNHHVATTKEAISNLDYFTEEEIKEMVGNSYEWAKKFDNFELKYDYRLVKEHDDSYKATIELIKELGRFDSSNPEHVKRLKHELNVIYSNGVLDFLPYFFPIAKVLKYYRENGRIPGPARGCLTKNTLVYTNHGVKNLNKIEVGDYVISHTGKWRKVLDKMAYDVEEELLNIKTEYSYRSNTMTKDHKLYGIKRKIIKGHNSKTKKYEDWNENEIGWYKAEEFKEGDLLFTPWPESPKNCEKFLISIDMSKYFPKNKCDDKFVYIEKPLYNEFSLRKMSKKTGVSRSTVSRVKKGKNCKKQNLEKIKQYLHKHNSTLEEWQQNKNIKLVKIKRFIDVDKKFCNFIGRWIGDGWTTKKGNGIGICFNTDEKKDIEYYTSYLKSLGWDLYENKAKNKKLVQYTIKNSVVWSLFKKMFPKYKHTSNTKHLSIFKYLPNKQLSWLLEGILGADGHVRNNRGSKFKKEQIDTTSKNLAEEIREVLLFLKIPSSIYIRNGYTRKQNNKEYLCKKSFKVVFKGLTVETSNIFNFKTEKGYFSKITKICKEFNNKVYDITVEKDFSYTTVDYVVHNSAGGSFLLYCMGITEVDPIKYGLYFSRFLTLGRIKKGTMPDVDIDLPNRDLLVNKDGFFDTHYKDRWAQISTRTLMKLKSSIRDVNRYKFGKVQEEVELLAKNLEPTPQGVDDYDFVLGYEDNEGNHVDGLLDKDENLQKYVKERPEEWEIVKRTLGISRQNGRHACGFVLSDIPVNEVIPTMKIGGHVVTQYEASEVETAGLMKYDFLIISCLKDIQLALEKINKKHFYQNGNRGGFSAGEFFHKGDIKYIWNLPEEPEVFEMLAQGKTETVFQLNTTSVTPFVQRIKPKSIEDCAVVTSLVRPGPLDFIDERTGRNMAEEYIERVNGRSKGDIDILNDMLPETHGVFVFQEQITKLTKELTGWDDEKAEDVRIAVGKKKIKMIQELRPQFIEAAVEKGFEEGTVTNVWGMIETFGRYGFNKSHAVAYAMIAYACSYLKYHHPLEWWAAILSNADDKEITEVLWPHVKDIISPPDINLSEEEIVIDYENETLRSKLSVLKGIGEKAANKIMKGRPYKDIHDFVQKQSVGHSLTKKLINIGVLDSLFAPKPSPMEKMKAYEDAREIYNYKKKIHDKSEGKISMSLNLSEFMEKAKKNPKTKRCSHKIKEGKVDIDYSWMEPIDDYLLKKSVFPNMHVNLYSILCDKPQKTKIIKAGKAYYAITPDGKEVRYVTGKTMNKIQELEPDTNSRQIVHYAISGYIIDTNEFSYRNNEKKAYKIIVDIDGYLEEFVIWPDRETGVLSYPEELKKKAVVTLFLQREMKKERYHTNINYLQVEKNG